MEEGLWGGVEAREGGEGTERKGRREKGKMRDGREGVGRRGRKAGKMSETREERKGRRERNWTRKAEKMSEEREGGKGSWTRNSCRGAFIYKKTRPLLPSGYHSAFNISIFLLLPFVSLRLFPKKVLISQHLPSSLRFFLRYYFFLCELLLALLSLLSLAACSFLPHHPSSIITRIYHSFHSFPFFIFGYKAIQCPAYLSYLPLPLTFLSFTILQNLPITNRVTHLFLSFPFLMVGY